MSSSQMGYAFLGMSVLLVGLIVAVIVVVPDLYGRTDASQLHSTEHQETIRGIQAEQSAINETLSGLDARVTVGETTSRSVPDGTTDNDGSYLDLDSLTKVKIGELTEDVHQLRFIHIQDSSTIVRNERSIPYGDAVLRNQSVLTFNDTSGTADGSEAPVSVPFDELQYAQANLLLDLEVRDEQDADHQTGNYDFQYVLDGDSNSDFPRVFLKKELAIKNVDGGYQITYSYPIKVGKIMSYEAQLDADLEIQLNRPVLWPTHVAEEYQQLVDDDLTVTLEYPYVDRYLSETTSSTFKAADGVERNVKTPVVKTKSILVVIRSVQADYDNEYVKELKIRLADVRLSYRTPDETQHEALVSTPSVDTHFSRGVHAYEL